MRHDDTRPAPSADTLAIPFLWVPEGETPSPEWLAAHPDWVRLEATFIPDPLPAAEPPVRLAQLVVPGALPPPPPLLPTERGRTGGLSFADDTLRIIKWLFGPDWSKVEELRPAPAQGEAVEMAGPDRNAGLPPALQAQPSRYRARAEKAEADIAAKVRKGRLSVHHLISVSVARDNQELLASAARAGWTMDEAENLMLLPADEETQAELAAAGDLRPVHAGGHPEWRRQVQQQLEGIKQSLEIVFGPVTGPARDQAALALIRALEARLRTVAMTMLRVTLRLHEAADVGENG